MQKYLSKKTVAYISRIALFIIFFWFGLIKILGLSPAEELVKQLYSITLSKSNIFTEESFVIFLGVVECGIGLLWLIPKLTKIAFTIFIVQMFATFGPLVLLPDITWDAMFVPSMEGQYIIKNIALIAVALNLLKGDTKSNTLVE